MMKRTTTVLLLCTVAVTTVTAMNLPAGWRHPAPNEGTQGWRGESSHRYLVVTGDFDGDRLADEARLLVREEKLGIGLLAKVSSAAVKDPMILDEMEDISALRYMGIELAPPGEYKTACAKGRRDCGPGEPALLILKYPGLNYFARHDE